MKLIRAVLIGWIIFSYIWSYKESIPLYSGILYFLLLEIFFLFSLCMIIMYFLLASFRWKIFKNIQNYVKNHNIIKILIPNEKFKLLLTYGEIYSLSWVNTSFFWYIFKFCSFAVSLYYFNFFLNGYIPLSEYPLGAYFELLFFSFFNSIRLLNIYINCYEIYKLWIVYINNEGLLSNKIANVYKNIFIFLCLQFCFYLYTFIFFIPMLIFGYFWPLGVF